MKNEYTPLQFGYFTQRDPSLIRPVYSWLYGPYHDFICHVNSHTGIDFDGPPRSNWYWGGDPKAILGYCRFCQILRDEQLAEKTMVGLA